MQVPNRIALDRLMDRIVAEELPGGRGFGAWLAFLHAHAGLMRRLTADLAEETGLTLGDFDVLAQLVRAGGELRMTELAARAFSSRSNMTRRIDRMAEEGAVCRRADDTDFFIKDTATTE